MSVVSVYNLLVFLLDLGLEYEIEYLPALRDELLLLVLHLESIEPVALGATPLGAPHTHPLLLPLLLLPLDTPDVLLGVQVFRVGPFVPHLSGEVQFPVVQFVLVFLETVEYVLGVFVLLPLENDGELSLCFVMFHLFREDFLLFVIV